MPKKVRTLRRVSTPTEIEELLTRIETAMFEPDRDGLAAAIERLGELSDESTLPAEALTKQLMDGTAKIPLIAFNLLETAAGDAYPDYLKRIADDRDVADLTRFAAQR